MLVVQPPSLPACAQTTPTNVFDSGASAVILTEISPDFDAENACATALRFTDRESLKVSTAFFEGSMMPPQLTVINPTTASAAAAERRISASYTTGVRAEARRARRLPEIRRRAAAARPWRTPRAARREDAGPRPSVDPPGSQARRTGWRGVQRRAPASAPA